MEPMGRQDCHPCPLSCCWAAGQGRALCLNQFWLASMHHRNRLPLHPSSQATGRHHTLGQAPACPAATSYLFILSSLLPPPQLL